MAVVQVELKLDECMKGVDLKNLILDLKTCNNYFIYEEEYKDCVRHYGSNPFRFNTKNLKGCFKHYVEEKVEKDKNPISDYFHISKLYRYDEISHLTKDKIYSFFCITSEGVDEIRVPCPIRELSKYTAELYECIKKYPDLLKDNKEGADIFNNKAVSVQQTIPVQQTVPEKKPVVDDEFVTSVRKKKDNIDDLTDLIDKLMKSKNKS
ncbi:hypothetical protein QKU48_gp1287 [Fadolivirus algeromassiliense]|jgi:hypothetical protein|uniref:Uncharacterized protein n=1 Tax=Fadolivirus FV1/VV64 TaxID=3070911 RepID=A0A7D3QV47_9VIRU|nr:hypothetical protein QKU48_gp1287 [Fadolivirus algeromassiliense]QKF94745.1 hypothetical protein Fadolivirus_1_1287 [Fadolivirus FV1/VV64]